MLARFFRVFIAYIFIRHAALHNFSNEIKEIEGGPLRETQCCPGFFVFLSYLMLVLHLFQLHPQFRKRRSCTRIFQPAKCHYFVPVTKSNWLVSDISSDPYYADRKERTSWKLVLDLTFGCNLWWVAFIVILRSSTSPIFYILDFWLNGQHHCFTSK